MKERVAIEWQSFRPERPPLVRVFLKVTMQNDSAAARWFLIPQKWPPDNWPEPAYYGLEIVELTGVNGRAMLTKFEGYPAYHAFLLAPGVTLAVQDVPLEYWHSALPADFELRTTTAARIRAGD